MADPRDVEVNVTLSDKTDQGWRSVERRAKQGSDTVKRHSDKMSSEVGRNIVSAVEDVSPKLARSITKLLGKTGNYAGPAIAAGIAAGAPFIAATVSAAIIGGAGIGGVVGGVILASRDARVQVAGKNLGANLMKGLEQDAEVFIAPVLRNIDKIETRFERMRGKIRNIFNNTSGFLDPLVDGALDGIDGILRGVDALTRRGGPVIDAFGDLFSETGRAIGDAFEAISGGSEDAAVAIRALTIVISESIVATGRAIRILTEFFGVITYIPRKIMDLQQALGILDEKTGDEAESADTATDAARRLSNAFRAQATDTEALTQGLKEAEEAVNGVYSAQRDLYASTTDVATALAEANQKIKENGRGLDLSTEKGRENRDTLIRVANALQSNYDKYVAVNGAGKAAQRVADQNRAAFIRLAEKAGYSAQQARNLANQLLNIPASRRTRIELEKEEAERRIKALQAKLAQVRSKQITVDVYVAASRLNKVYNQLERLHGGAFDASNRISLAGPGSGAFRTESARPVNVMSNVESRLYLDGSLVYTNTARQIRANNDYHSWRQETGRR